MPGTSRHPVQDRLNCEALLTQPSASWRPYFFGSPAETSDLDLEFIVLVFPTCDTLVRICTPVAASINSNEPFARLFEDGIADGPLAPPGGDPAEAAELLLTRPAG